ncbi:hypothetical protein BDZ97DRAFT_1767554 [Flammula alnicola]|nr:hypothetical protein BDZ97DRAFT_1767554 [Flammula alnicola]
MAQCTRSLYHIIRYTVTKILSHTWFHVLEAESSSFCSNAISCPSWTWDGFSDDIWERRIHHYGTLLGLPLRLESRRPSAGVTESSLTLVRSLGDYVQPQIPFDMVKYAPVDEQSRSRALVAVVDGPVHEKLPVKAHPKPWGPAFSLKIKPILSSLVSSPDSSSNFQLSMSNAMSSTDDDALLWCFVRRNVSTAFRRCQFDNVSNGAILRFYQASMHNLIDIVLLESCHQDLYIGDEPANPKNVILVRRYERALYSRLAVLRARHDFFQTR